MLRATAPGACRDCAQMGFGGPKEHRYTAFDNFWRDGRDGALGRDGYPKLSVNLANLTAYIRVTDLALGGPGAPFKLERSYNSDNQQPGPFGIGWSFGLGDRLTVKSDGTLVLTRGSGAIDVFAPSFPAGTAPGGYFAITSTSDTLAAGTSGTFTLATPGSKTTRIFSPTGLLMAIQESGVTTVSLTYDPNNNLTAANYRGRMVTFANDGNGHITAFTDSAGRSASFSYTGDGHLAQQTNVDGTAIGYQYDGNANLTGIAYPSGNLAITWLIDGPFTSVAAVVTPDGAVRSYTVPQSPTQIQLTYCGFSPVYAAGNCTGNSTLYTSSATGLLLGVTDAYNNTRSYAYDASGRRTQAIDAMGDAETFVYDANGNLTAVADAAGDKWAATYTANLPATITDPRGNVYTFAYDSSGNLLSVTNPVSGGLTATRTAAGQVASLTNALGAGTTYQYGPDGLLSAFVDAMGGNWAYQYDNAARVQSRTDAGGATLTASYNTGLHPATVANGGSQLSYNFSGQVRDPLGRLVQYTDSFGNQLTYTYNVAGLLAGITLPGSKTVTYQYDQANRLSQVSDWQGDSAVYSYDAAGWPLSVNISGGPLTIYQYDAAHRLRALVSTGPDGTPVAGYRYTLDAAGNRTAASALEPVPAMPALPSYTIAYNAANHPVSRSDGQTYQYDADSHLVAIGGSGNLTLTYDPFERLAAVSGIASNTYAYDSEGLRVTASAANLVYDPSGREPHVVAQVDSSNNAIAWYIYGLGLAWEVTANGTPYFYHFDGDGNVVAVSNPTAGVVNTYRYDPLGRLVSSNETVPNIFHAHGERGWVDDGDGLLFTGSRFLFPDLHLSLPGLVDLRPPMPSLSPELTGAGACLVEGVAHCPFAAGRRSQ
jgi:YD repeat-containing protein